MCESKEELSKSTFLCLRLALARSTGAYSKRLRWCPGCLYEQSLRGIQPYLKLCWFLDAVKACDIHRLVLRETCPHCARVPRPWHGWACFAECPYCGGRTDIAHASDQVELDPEAAAPDLIRFVGDIATRSEPFPAGAVNWYVDRVFEDAWASEREVNLWAKLPRDECLRYSAPGEPITLPVARRIAHRLEVPLLELLHSDRPAVQSFGFASEAQLPGSMQGRHRPKAIDRVRLAKQLQAILADPLDLASLPVVAKRLSVSVGAIRYHCPQLAASLVQRRELFRRADAARKRSEARRAVRCALAAWPRTERAMAKKALLRELCSETELPKNLLRVEIQAHWGLPTSGWEP